MIYNIQGNIICSAYDVDGDSISTAYDVAGELIWDSGSSVVDYDNYTLSDSFNISISSTQGLAVHDNVLFQFRASGTSVRNLVSLFDLTDKSTIISNMTINSEHGDSASFSNEYYANGDEFPLIYVTADTTPAKLYVDRVSRTEATLVKTLVFPSSAGYWGAGAFDFENNICYILAYKIQSYTSATNNATVVSKWDLSNLTDNGDGTYTPAFISQFECDFIYCMQGLEYHDGMIWVTSGNGGQQSYVYAISPTDGSLLHTIDLNTTTEVEGCAFLSDTQVLVGFQRGSYRIYTFATT